MDEGSGVDHEAQVKPESGSARNAFRLKTAAVVAALLFPALIPLARATTPAAAVERTLHAYASAISAQDVAAVERTMVATDALSVFEYAKPPLQPDRGWKAYRDDHLVPEFEVAITTNYAVENVRAHVGGDMAYATFDYSVRMLGQIPGMPPRTLGGHGFGTAVLVRREGSWRIQHLHTTAEEMGMLD